MELATSINPDEHLAHHLTQLIGDHSGTTICLCAGGSALKIFDHLHLSEESKVRTIWCMGDDRMSGEADANNYLQLTKRLKETGSVYQVLDTSQQDGENLLTYTKRLNQQLAAELNQPKLQIIAILGMGTDGHTAGIFPMEAEAFAEVYQADSMYVPIELNGSEFNFRASITPAWLLANVDHVLGYITGESKKDKLQALIHTSLELHEMPAQLIKMHTQSHIYTDIEL